MVFQFMLMAVGAFFLLRFLLCALKMAFNYLPLLTGPKIDVKALGKWAVVTGATDGIGKAYAFELARRGMNIVLVSRNPTKLAAVAKEIEEVHPVATKVVAADFTRTDIYEAIEEALRGLDVGVLVNNVGVGYEYPEFLEKVEDPHKFCSNLINANMQSVARMSLIVLPAMKANKRGLIINISSMSGASPMPLLTLYASSKTFVMSFSRSLEVECEGSGVMVQCIMPGFVVTNMSKLKRASLQHPSPATFVSSALATVGGASVCAGYWVHDLIMNTLILLDLFTLPKPIARYTMGFLAKIRARAIARKQE